MTFTYRVLRERLLAERIVDFVCPYALDSAKDVLLGNVFDLGNLVVGWIISEYKALHLILSPSKPSFLYVMQDDLHPGLCACDEALIRDCDIEGSCSRSKSAHNYLLVRDTMSQRLEQLTSQKATQVRSWMRQLILLIPSLLQCYIYPQIMCARRHSDTRACEFRANLVIASCDDPLLRTSNVESRDWRMMRRLFRQIRDSDLPRRIILLDDPTFHRACARRRRRRLVLRLGERIVDLPIAAEELA